MNTPPPRLSPIPSPQWDASVLDALGAFPAGLKFVLDGVASGDPDRLRGSYLLGALAHHPPLAKAFLTFNGYLASASTLSARIRELAILRISWLRYSEYEFVQHLILGRRAGLSDDELEWIKQGSAAPGWSADEALLLRAVEELHEQAGVSDASWAALQRQFNAQQLMDLLFLVGCYHTLALVLNSIRLPVEPTLAASAERVRAQMNAARDTAGSETHSRLAGGTA